MKKLTMTVMALMLFAGGQSAWAQQGPIVGFDVLGLSNGETNFYYQDKVFSNSAFRIGGASSGGSLNVDLGFRFYFDRYAASPYIQGDILFGAASGNRVQMGIDLPMGNLVLDPNIWAGGASNGVGLNLGLRL